MAADAIEPMSDGAHKINFTKHPKKLNCDHLFLDGLSGLYDIAHWDPSIMRRLSMIESRLNVYSIYIVYDKMNMDNILFLLSY
jgi:hypothetical protein